MDLKRYGQLRPKGAANIQSMWRRAFMSVTSRMLWGLRSPWRVLALCMNLRASAMSSAVSSAQRVLSILLPRFHEISSASDLVGGLSGSTR